MVTIVHNPLTKCLEDGRPVGVHGAAGDSMARFLVRIAKAIRCLGEGCLDLMPCGQRRCTPGAAHSDRAWMRIHVHCFEELSPVPGKRSRIQLTVRHRFFLENPGHSPEPGTPALSRGLWLVVVQRDEWTLKQHLLTRASDSACAEDLTASCEPSLTERKERSAKQPGVQSCGPFNNHSAG